MDSVRPENSDGASSSNGQREGAHYMDWSMLSRAAIQNRAYIEGLTNPINSDGEEAEEDTPEPQEPTPPIRRGALPPNHIPPILLQDSEVVDLNNLSEPEEEEEEEAQPLPPPRHENVILSHPEIVVPPHLVPMAVSNREFKVIMRRVRMDCGELIWDVRLYRGRNNNPPGWEPVRGIGDTSSESDDTDSENP